MKLIKSVRNQEFNERRAKRLCFQCDEKFVPGHKCKNKKLYQCKVDDEGEDVQNSNNVDEEEPNLEQVTHHITINILEGVYGFHTPRVIGKVDKHPLFIMVDSSTIIPLTLIQLLSYNVTCHIVMSTENF